VGYRNVDFIRWAVEVVKEIKGVCSDPENGKFVSYAISASADYILSGDKDLFDLKLYQSTKIIKASAFLKCMMISGG
jgi:predicted nucleic acid-binding protein